MVGASSPTSPKQRALLIDLLLQRGGLVRRDRLIDDLWGDDPPTTAAGVLQNYVSQLRQRLGSDAVRTAGTGYAAGEHVVVDVDELEAHLERAHAARCRGRHRDRPPGHCGGAGAVARRSPRRRALRAIRPS